MTGLIDHIPELTAFGLAVIALVGALWWLNTRMARLEVNDTAQDQRFKALEDRVAQLELPEVIRRAEQRHLLTQAMLRKRNGYGGQDTEGRA